MNHPGSLLIVDDEADVGDVLRDFFESHGYAVRCALNGRDALALASLARPDAVMLDVRMPGRGGAEVLRDLLALDGSIAVIMMSGYDNERVARELRQAGAFDYVAKPFVFGNLAEVVRRAVLVGKRASPPRNDASPSRGASRTLEEQTPPAGADTRCGGCREPMAPSDATAVRGRDGLYHAACWLTRFTGYVPPGPQLAR